MEKLDEVVNTIKNSKEYKTCIELKSKMDSNEDINSLVKEIKKLQKKYINTNDSNIKMKLDELENRLNEIPIYHIYLDNLENTSTMYIVDENNVKHMAYSHETSKEQLQIFAHSQKEIQIKFSNSYISGREILKMTFENVIFDETKNECKQISIKLK